MRGPRISYPGAIFHVINRFVDKHPFFKDTSDYKYFLQIYYEEAISNKIITYAYCLLPNHFHIILETETGDISKFLQRFLTRVAQSMNKKYNRTGHLFQGRSKTLLIQSKKYFSTAIGYVFLNSVRAGLSKDVWTYKWNSINETLKLNNDKISINKLFNNILPHTTNSSKEKKILQFKNWIDSLDKSKNELDFKNSHRGCFLSDTTFRKQILNSIERRKNENKVEKLKRKNDKYEQFEIDLEGLKNCIHKNLKKAYINIWKNENFAINHLCWYFLYSKMRWTLGEICEKEKISTANKKKVSAAVCKIRNNINLKNFAEKMFTDIVISEKLKLDY